MLLLCVSLFSECHPFIIWVTQEPNKGTNCAVAQWSRRKLKKILKVPFSIAQFYWILVIYFLTENLYLFWKGNTWFHTRISSCNPSEFGDHVVTPVNKMNQVFQAKEWRLFRDHQLVIQLPWWIVYLVVVNLLLHEHNLPAEREDQVPRALFPYHVQ